MRVSSVLVYRNSRSRDYAVAGGQFKVAEMH